MRLARRHPDRTIKANVFAVEVAILAHFNRQRGILVRVTETGRVWNLSTKGLANLFWRWELHLPGFHLEGLGDV